MSDPIDGAIDTQHSFEEEALALRDKILWALEVFPFISKSMIHQAVGTGVPRTLWMPILNKLVADGDVTCITVYAKTPTDRNQQYIIYHLKNRQYIATHDNITLAPAGLDADQAQADATNL